jgi:hypothetical protein|tara:strand:+ start:1580 stop:1858 length:279 start_codon:yes stop_codon:yes gene_type:complete
MSGEGKGRRLDDDPIDIPVDIDDIEEYTCHMEFKVGDLVAVRYERSINIPIYEELPVGIVLEVWDVPYDPYLVHVRGEDVWLTERELLKVEK